MDEVSIEDARPRLGDIIDRARIAGQSTIITRHGKPAAAVMPVADARCLTDIRSILASFDWEHDDRQYALEAIERIVGAGSRP